MILRLLNKGFLYSSCLRNTLLLGAFSCSISGAAVAQFNRLLNISSMVPRSESDALSTFVIIAGSNFFQSYAIGFGYCNELYTANKKFTILDEATIPPTLAHSPEHSAVTYLPRKARGVSAAPLGYLQAVQNETLAPSASRFVLATQPGYRWIASTTTRWLTLTHSTRTFPGVVGITANASGMPVGTYAGSVTVSAGGLTVSFPVSLSVWAGAASSAPVATLSTAAGYPAGSALGWLSISPASGTAPATIQVVVDPNNAIRRPG